jgi:NADPH:quinone reductase-like Zn-dependent oxidoreductase
MKSVVVLSGDQSSSSSNFYDSVATIKLEGTPVTFGRIETVEPMFDSEAPENRGMVLIKVKAFSCNFRDKALIFSASLPREQEYPEGAYSYIGSEFVGEVVAVGAGVTVLREGDRVIGDNQYPGGAYPGVPTNHASRRYLAVHEAKLVKIPQAMRDEVAAAFSIGAQTSYSMIRKLHLTKDANVLVTAARSNTSLFAMNALKNHQVNVHAISTSMWPEIRLEQLGLEELVQVDLMIGPLSDNEALSNIVFKVGGFDHVIDPFFDLHIGKVVDLMKIGAKYITCGFYDQYSHIIGNQFQYLGLRLLELMQIAMLKNIHIIGNCLGRKEDLIRAIEDYDSGSLDVIIDSVFTGQEVGAFFERTYKAADRFGKVVYQYADTD